MPDFNTSQYITTNNSSTGTYGTITISDWVGSNGTAELNAGDLVFRIDAKKGIRPELYFKYIKKKFKNLEGMRLDARLRKLEKAFDKAVESGQRALGEKLLTEILRESRESMIYAKGIKHFIEYDDLNKHKRNLLDGHISDTKYEDFTRVIPKSVIEKKKKVEGVFDGFVIYHYWDERAASKQKMSPDEKAKMKDPVLFGVIRESNRLYFIADWEDEYCDLSFDDMIEIVGRDDDEITLTNKPVLNL